MPASRRCPTPGCPNLISPGQRYCHTHTHAYEVARGTTTQRGYGARHQALRAQWAARIQAGQVIPCARCGTPLTPTDTWDLGHTNDRTTWTGPEHTDCNRSAGGTAGNQAMRSRLDT